CARSDGYTEYNFGGYFDYW
nr:immunoglobulin heavy chain junction region [Macaca mulatta]MOY21132.1 immunoglobulin heavy chain junction region [Macaca mulatta]MOY21731.1 immunoglobulin heavy chain junction region [Macaca mulatta]MOY21930.1 immunoglobulin heavy chain junction region [Macaca mulatta]MOY22610.1 immunoglobulin heavy chain junction region [Macaca mulatta]